MSSNIFELATRNKMRFPYNGNISCEQLWQLNEKQLDEVYVAIKSVMRESEKAAGLLANKNTEDSESLTKLAIIEHIFNVKAEERKAAFNSKQRKENLQRLLAIKQEREEMKIKSASDDEIDKMIAELQA